MILQCNSYFFLLEVLKYLADRNYKEMERYKHERKNEGTKEEVKQ
jgi:hypothetical protein